MTIRRNSCEKVFNSFNIIFMLILSFTTLYPLLYVVMASVSSPVEIMAYRGPLLRPLGFSINSYLLVFKDPMILRGYLNTLIIVVVGVTINILMTSIGAYFLSRKNVIWRNAVMVLISITMFFSGGLIPLYFTVRELGLYNTYWALILPGAINTFNLIIMRTAFSSIPDSFEESARLDGAGHFIILFRIIIPLSLPTIAVMMLYYGVGHWNSWFSAMIYLRDRKMYPLQLILREILIDNDINKMTLDVSELDKENVGLTVKYATIIVATLPILGLYPFLQKYFVKGVMVGGLKG